MARSNARFEFVIVRFLASELNLDRLEGNDFEIDACRRYTARSGPTH
jgi:hypothetical protein